MKSDSTQNDKNVVVEDLEKMDFDDWKTLFEQNPERFEEYRKRMLEHQIKLAPEKSKQRLRGLMFQMECESAKACTPLNYNQRLYAMMMDQFDELREKLQLLCKGDTSLIPTNPGNQTTATVIPFNRQAKSLQPEV